MAKALPASRPWVWRRLDRRALLGGAGVGAILLGTAILAQARLPENAPAAAPAAAPIHHDLIGTPSNLGPFEITGLWDVELAPTSDARSAVP